MIDQNFVQICEAVKNVTGYNINVCTHTNRRRGP
jgi:hypothetical protein